MMFDIANVDDSFGYIHTDNNGRIGSVGTLCKVVSRELQPDGRQFIAVEGVSRFTVTKILKTLPYVLAEIEPNLTDTAAADEEAARKLESEVYDSLKYYMRLMKTYGPNKMLVISQAAKKSRPSLAGSKFDYAHRRTDFSFALANMIQMAEARASQLLLQTTDVLQRLSAEKEILMQASELIAEQLMNMELLTADVRDSLKFKAYSEAADDDILPPDIIAEEDADVKDEWDLANME
jgi:Lon protease-like protein